MKIIDGSQGEGGGQILRSTLALSMCTGTPVRIENIRAGRRKTGLLRQHLACVRASKEICNAKVTGDELGSSSVEFHPNKISAGSYDFAIGSAGSTSLLFQTVLPALLIADGESIVSFSGGTHNDLAPSFDFIKHCFIPALRSVNLEIEADLEAYGFMPNGGGKWLAKIKPINGMSKLDMTKVKEFSSKQAIVTQAGISQSVAERELAHIKKKLQWPDNQLHINLVNSSGPGNIVSLRVSNGNLCEVIDAVGSKKITAERVAGRAASSMKRFLKSKAAVGEYLCDQLLLPLALGNGGEFTTVKLSLHSTTNIDVIKEFIDCQIDVTELDQDRYKVSISK